MIITCYKCDKKFDIDANVIPEKGRLLQCSGCNYKWFFIKEKTNEDITTIKTNKPTAEPAVSRVETVVEETKESETMELLERANYNNIAGEKISIKEEVKKSNDTNKDKNSAAKALNNKKNYNILTLSIIFIISFTALIIVLDTFQGPISKIVPNIEFLLYNLYESINDILLFFSDLI
jgi:predicted Zn finger-like uncharacterized protein